MSIVRVHPVLGRRYTYVSSTPNVETYADGRGRRRAGFGFYIPSVWSSQSHLGILTAHIPLRTSLGLRLLAPRSNATIGKPRVAPGIGRRWKYGWLDLTRFGDTTCVFSICRLGACSDADQLPPGRWNAARAFATYLDAHQQLYQNRNVIELGAGGGLPGIVAALDGANTVC